MKINNFKEYIDSDEILQELCNPHSLNLKQVKESLRQFCDDLAVKQIITAERSQQLKTIIEKPKKYFESLTEEEIVNLIKWQIIIDFFINYTSSISQQTLKKQTNTKKMTQFSEAYKISLRKLFTMTTQFQSEKGYNSWQIPVEKSNELNLKNKFKYACFEVIACILDLNLILSFQSCQEMQAINKKYVIQNDSKIFYFVDVGEVLQKANYWTELQNFFIGKDQEKEEDSDIKKGNREIMKLFYLGLTIETLEFESVSSSLRFTSELLLFIINENNSCYSSKNQQYVNIRAQDKQIFTMAAHLNKILYFLRILKKNNLNVANLNGSQDPESPDVTPLESLKAISRQQIISKQTTELNKADPVQSSEVKVISGSKYGTENQNNFLNELEYKTQKLMQKISAKYKDVTMQLESINQTYEPLVQILILKHPNTGAELISNFTATKRNKVVNFTQEEKKIFFVFMAQKLKKIYSSFDLNWHSLYKSCKQTFLNFQQNKKVQHELKKQQNKRIKAQLINQFQCNLNKSSEIATITTKTFELNTKKFLDTLQPKANFQRQTLKSQQSKGKLQVKKQNNNIYFPTLKSKLSLQVQNRLKIKEIKQQKQEQIFFLSQQKLTHKKITSNVSKKPQTIKIQPASTIVSTKKLKQAYQPLLRSLPKQKSTSLPGKIKLNTNYEFKSRFDNIKSYQNTRNTILQRKFSYEMILCKRQNGNSLENNVFNHKKNSNVSESQLYENLEIKRKQRSERSKLKLKTKISYQQSSNLKINRNQSYHSKASKRRNKSSEPTEINKSTSGPQIPSEIVEHLMKASRRRNTIRRDSFLLRSSVDKVKKTSKLTEQNDQINQNSKNPLPLLNQSKSEGIGNLLIESINVIIENCKKVTKNGNEKTKLKLESRLSLIGKKKSDEQLFVPKIIQQEESKLGNLKFEDASEILTSMEQYYRTFLQIQKYRQLLEQKYQAYLQLENLERLIQQKAIFLFKGIVFTVRRKQTLQKKQKDKYWSTFRLFFQYEQMVLIVEIEEKQIIQNSQLAFSQYLSQKLSSLLSPKKYYLKGKDKLKQNKKGFMMVGNLGGNLDIYFVNFISLYQGPETEQIKDIIRRKRIQNDETFRFLQVYNHNKDGCQILGLDKKKNTIDGIELYVTRQLCHTGQSRRTQKFVNQFFFAPLNQYIMDWGCNSLMKSQTQQTVQQQQEQVRTVFSRQQNRANHIYFLNRSYEMRSRFKSSIKKLDRRYPSFSYQQFFQAAYCLSNQERQFCENVDIIEYTCKNLIFNKRYMLFNLKIIKVVEKMQKKVFIMIEQKNSSLSDHRLIFFVFPLRVRLKLSTHRLDQQQNQQNQKDSSQGKKDQAAVTREVKNAELMQNYYSNLMYNIQKYHSLTNICDFLVANHTIEINNWTDTMFNKLLLTYPHISIIKKVFLEDSCSTNNYISNTNNTLQIQKRRSNDPYVNAQQTNSNKKFHVFATLKVFILNQHNLVVGVIEISGQSFLFISLFNQLIEKVPRYKCRPLSRNYIDKYRSGTNPNGHQLRSSKKKCSNGGANFKQKRNHVTIKKLSSEDSFLMSAKKLTKQSITTHKALKTEKVLMTEEEEMTNIKQRLLGLFKYETDLFIGLNIKPQKDGKRRLTMDRYTSKYRVSMKVDGEAIKLMQIKYYWPDIIPESRSKSLNFRMGDDSLMLIKLNRNGYFLRKSNKVRDIYSETCIQKVTQNKIKFKGNAMNDHLRKHDKLIYYEIYKEFIQEAQKYFFFYNVEQSLLVKIRLGISSKSGYLASVVDFDVQTMIESLETLVQDKEKLKKIVDFSVKADNLSMFDVGNLALNRKMLNNKKFRKRINHLVKDQLQSIFRKF